MHSHLDVLSTCSAPSISRLTARRTSVTEFEVTLQLQYLGSSNITSIMLCYRQDSNLATNTTCIDDLEWQVGSTLLLRTLTVTHPYEMKRLSSVLSWWTQLLLWVGKPQSWRLWVSSTVEWLSTHVTFFIRECDLLHCHSWLLSFLNMYDSFQRTFATCNWS